MKPAPELFEWLKKATWSLPEAAALTIGALPDPGAKPSDEEGSSVSDRNFFWLQKEYSRGNLTRVGGTDDNPRFSPGSLIRRLKEENKYVDPNIDRLYTTISKSGGPPMTSEDVRAAYVSAARAWRKVDPDIPIKRIADGLASLRATLGSANLPARSSETIRKYLSGHISGSVGRPKKAVGAEKGTNTLKMPNEVAKKLV